MALATTCPQCKTSFKVVPDQLKLRRGLVRCGACQHVFSAIESLRYVGESTPRRSAPEADAMQPPDVLQTAFFLPETILVSPADVPPADVTPADVRPVNAWQVDARPVDARPVDARPVDARPAGDVRADAMPADPVPANATVVGAPGPDTRPLAADLPSGFLLPTMPRTSLPIESDSDGFATFAGDDDSGSRAAATAIPDQAGAHDAAGAHDDAVDAIVEWGPVAAAPQSEQHEPYEAHTEHEPVESLTATTPPGFPGIDTGDDSRDATHDEAFEAIGSWEDAARPRCAMAGLERHRAPQSWRTAGAAARDTVPHEDESESAIDYFSTGPRGIGFVDRHGPIALATAVLLVMLLVVQWTIAQRAMIAARLPALAPVLSITLAPFGLRIGPPRDLAALTIESFELQASGAPGVLAMSALLRNRADYGVLWPSMQLTLTDASNRVLVRKVLGPDDYLHESRGGEGLPARAEWPLRLALEAENLTPAGYSVVLFYP